MSDFKKTLGVELLTALVDEIRAAPDVWQKLSEAQQQEVIDRLAARSEHLIVEVIEAVNVRDFPRLRATVDSVSFKDGCKLVLKIDAHIPAVHDLIEQQGQDVLVVIVDPESFIHGIEQAVKPDADQPDLPLSAGGTDGDGDDDMPGPQG